jgi:hypothetical protein
VEKLNCVAEKVISLGIGKKEKGTIRVKKARFPRENWHLDFVNPEKPQKTTRKARRKNSATFEIAPKTGNFHASRKPRRS